MTASRGGRGAAARKLTPGMRVRHKATGREYVFHAYPSSLDFPGSRYVLDADGVIREFLADEIEAIDTTPVKLTAPELVDIEVRARVQAGHLARLLGPRETDPILDAVFNLVAEVRQLRAGAAATKVNRVRQIIDEMPDTERCRLCEAGESCSGCLAARIRSVLDGTCYPPLGEEA